MPVTFVENHLHFNSHITNICYIILMINHIPVPNVVELLKNYQLYKIMKEFIAENVLLLAKLVEKASGREFHIWYTGNYFSKTLIIF